MPKGYVETKSGSRVRPPRYGVSPSCSPLWRRYRHDCSTGNAGPWRRLYDIPERPWAGFIPSVRGQRGDELLAGARSRRRLGRGLRPVGPVAATQGRGGLRPGRRSGDTPSGERYSGSFRACPGGRPHGRVHASGHTPGQPGAMRGDTLGPALAERPAAGGHRPGLTDLGDAPVADAAGRTAGRHVPGHELQPSRHGGQGAGGWATGVTALPQPPYPTLGQPAEHRGGEP